MSACRSADPRIFDTGNDRSPARVARKRASALAICGSCPVRDLCLQDHLEFEAGYSDDPTGIVGGMLPEDRKPLVQQMRQKLPAGAAA